MAIGSHGRGRGGTVGHGRLEESVYHRALFFVSVHFCNTWHCNEPSTHRQASRQLTAERPVCFCFFTLPEVELTISRNLPF